MPPTETVWPIEEHTRGKHLVLRGYLDAWLSILGSSGRLVYIDGFAGPGEYLQGEPGSPLVALEAFSNHRYKVRLQDVRFLFIEKAADRAAYLDALIRRRFPGLAANQWEVVPGECTPTVLGLLDDLEANKRQLAPTFMMLDPFGAAGLSMELIKRFFVHQRTEVYVSFMYESFRRFHETAEFERHLDELYGCEEWREAFSIPDEESKREAAYALYVRQLKASGASQVVHFDLYRGGQLVYSIFFGTRSLIGCDRMKQSIWSKASPDGSYEFRGSRTGQLNLRLGGPNYEMVKNEILSEFGRDGWISIDDIQEFMQSDRTNFHSTQYKKIAMKELEVAGKIEVHRAPGGRAGTFPAGTKVRVL